MSIVAGFDVHRAQITVDLLDTESGEVSRGRVAPADRLHVRRFLKGFDGGGPGRRVGGHDGLALCR